jgi:hypothetical protein
MNQSVQKAPIKKWRKECFSCSCCGERKKREFDRFAQIKIKSVTACGFKKKMHLE